MAQTGRQRPISRRRPRPGTQAFAAAQFQAPARMLVHFSASPEFLSDVQVTAQHAADAQHWLSLARIDYGKNMSIFEFFS